MMLTIKTDRLSLYQEETEAELERILAFWMQYAIDEQKGGFIGQMDTNNQINPEAEKGLVLNARILWTFSAAYRYTNNKKYRSVADRAFSYLIKHFCDQEYGGVYWSVDSLGNPLNTRKQIYALAFAIYGLSEYHRATTNFEALQACQSLFHWIEKHSYDPKHEGYFEAFSREGQLLDDLRLSEKDRNDPKTMNTHLHVLEAYANLYKIWPDKQLAHQLEALLETFLLHIVDRKSGHMHLFFTNNWVPTTHLVSFGHDIEASWLLLEAAEARGNKVLINKTKIVAAEMAKAAAKELQPDGSLYHEYNRKSKHYDTHREWWVSAEAMVGFMNAYQITKDVYFMDKSWNAWRFVQQHLVDNEKGEWFWGVYDDYRVMQAEDKIGFWKCPYHNARACLEIMIRCQTELLERQIKTAGN